MDWYGKGRLSGSFETNSFEKFVSSPFDHVPMCKTSKFRDKHDHSRPRDHLVNSNSLEENSTVRFDSIDNIGYVMQFFGQGCLIAKTDIEDELRTIPIQLSDYRLLWFIWYFNLKREKFSSALQ